MKYWRTPLFALGMLSLFCLLFVGSPAVNFVGAADNVTEVGSSAEVGETLSVTLNASSITWTGLVAGTSVNVSATTGGSPLNVTIHLETNVATNVSVNGSNLVTGGNTLTVANVTYANNTVDVKSELATAFSSGKVGAAGDKPYENWVNIPDPAVDTERDISWFISTPAGLPQGTYTGTFYVKVNKNV